MCLCLLLPSVSAHAQRRLKPAPAEAPTEPDEPRTWEIGPWVGGARNSPATFFLGVTPGRNHLFLGVQAITPLRRTNSLRLSYVANILPLVVVTGRTAPIGYFGTIAADGHLPGPARSYAFGAAPIGLEIASRDDRRVGVFGVGTAGALVFTRPFPVSEARRWNFTMELGGGVRLRTRGHQWIQAGYRFHHLSNAYTAEMNPGLDAHVFYASYLWRTARR